MGVYIKGMVMPNPGHIVLVEIDENGNVFAAYDGGRTKLAQYTAVPVPPHGRLIDADELLMHRFVGVVGEAEKSSYMVGWNSAIEAVVENARTVIPAEEGELDG